MADLVTDTKAISKRNEGFPEWLDFDKMRKEGIEYIAQLSGKIWTDHNIHDPGITILEMLCYALLDLGYRTSLPAKDLFAKDPDDHSKESNFFTPAQILGCNPLTITDYRRLLVDIPGVKNAWLDVADDITINRICGYDHYTTTKAPYTCRDFLNGLYHVYIDLENNPDDDQKMKIIDNVKKSLMEYRNLCEDFFDITVLCKQKIGVCADIVLDAKADRDKIFLQLIETLRDFFSPSPRFYRLKQLIEEKGRSIEQVFAGRPFDLSRSHGFVDIEEFEKLGLRKEIHLSDIYNIIFRIPGIINIRNLTLQNCDGTICRDNTTNWTFKIYENHVPDFSLDCSDFRFTQNGGSVIIDKKKFSDYFKLNFTNSGKTLSNVPSSNLDYLPEQGNYREDLAEYYLIENEFPKVYGIAKGSLPDDVSALRKSQSLQLRSYLLFFDHFLSGYLSQLKNIRNLFSFRPTKEKNSYYINRISSDDWPDLQKLVGYSLEENFQADILAMPVRKQDLDALIQNNRINHCEGENFLQAYQFTSKSERDIAIHQMIEDLNFGSYSGDVIQNKNDCWSYYFYGSSDKFAIIAKGFYKTEADANKALDSLRYSCTDKKSYRAYSTDNNTKFSFEIVTSVAGYWDFLQGIMEDEKLYLERRNEFLDHLLARFAESFTDYALLSYNFMQDNELQKNIITKKENFLTNYAELSSTRGKAYNYQLNGWNNNNVAGLEKRFGALTGIGYEGSSKQAGQQRLCNFEVLELPEQTVVNISWKDQVIFTSEKSFESREDGRQALSSLLMALTGRENYHTDLSKLEGKYTIRVSAAGTNFLHPQRYETEAEAQAVIPQLQRMFSPSPLKEDIIPSQFKHTIFLRRKHNDNRWVRKQPIITGEATLTITPKLLSDFKDAGTWLAEDLDMDRGAVAFQSNPAQPLELININAFEPYINRVDVKKKSTIYKYAVNDPEKNFFFISSQEFGSENEAREQMLQMLFLLTDASNLYVGDINPNLSVIYVKGNEGSIATNTIEFTSHEESERFIPRIVDYANQQVYKLEVDSTPVNWRYQLKLGIPGNKTYNFISRVEFNSPDKASQEAGKVVTGTGNFEIFAGKNKSLELKDKKRPGTVKAYYGLQKGENPENAKSEAGGLLSLKKTLHRVLLNPADPEAEMMVVADKISRQGNYAYQLVDKDSYHAVFNRDGDYGKDVSGEKVIREVFSDYQNNHEYLQICYGGENIVNARSGPNGVKWYHFLVKTSGSGNETVLFESVAGYTSAEEAEKAFEKQHVHILTAASEINNYDTLISFDEIFIHDTDNILEAKAQVFIPKMTMERFGFNKDKAKYALSAIASTYPIRSIKNTDQLFADYFLCGNRAEEPDTCCEDCANGDKYFYYYVYRSKNDKTGGWRSYRYFDSSREALSAFRFFLLLLRYKGNYFIGQGECDCTGLLYLREILAISKRRFPTADDAWGEEGVMKFICASQSKDAFPAYMKDDGCCYTFHIACGTPGLIHPCTYDSPKQRDLALRRLYNASHKFFENIDKLDWNKLTEDVFGKAAKKGISCDDAIKHIEWFLEKVNDYAGSGIPGVDIEKARWFAHYYPVSKRTVGDKPDTMRYYVKINLPDFCREDLTESGPCTCNGKDKDIQCCCTAWESEYCFETCEEALRYYYKVAKFLANIDNYYTVFDCDCSQYGIRFQCDCEQDEKQPGSDIVAVNPQCYTTQGMTCEAIKRAKRLINAGGLHLVEHILLRPHCKDEDCKCIIPACDDINGCGEFEWALPDDDRCERGQNYCFVPGRDPYSFIATAVLPAWPERYRKRENRQLLEQLLNREIPAHIMLRILWLTPKDLCHFEGIYHSWTRWLAHKEICEDYSPPCRMIGFLFDHQFGCFDCEECNPCETLRTIPDPCNFIGETVDNPDKYVNEINDLYCWAPICPKSNSHEDSRYSKPEQARRTAAPPTRLPDIEDSERIIDQRFYRYREEVRTIADATGNVNAGMALSFLSNPSPGFSTYVDMIDAIVANKKSKKNVEPLSKEQKSKLIRSVTGYYLDRLVLEDKFSAHRPDLSELFRKLESRQLLPTFREWKGTELAKLRQTTDISEVKMLLKKRS